MASHSKFDLQAVLHKWFGNRYTPYVLISLLSLVFFATSPMDGSFGWSDAPRHALNGLLVKDMVTRGWSRGFLTYAFDYYVQYPSLTIFFYPPLFYAINSLSYALLGEAHWVAQLTVALHYFMMGAGMYVLARKWLDLPQATICALLLMVAPVNASWGRQVMLEVPSMAFLVWSAVFLTGYLESGRKRDFKAAVVIWVLGLYTKLNVIFFLPVIFAAWLLKNGFPAIRSRGFWKLAAYIALGILPLVIHQLIFGAHNVMNALGAPDIERTRFSLENWLWFFSHLPSIAGWGMTILFLACAPLILVRFRFFASRKESLIPPLWFAAGFLFFSWVLHKEVRFANYALPPLILMVFIGLQALPDKVRNVLGSLVVLATLSEVLLFIPPVSIQGPEAAAAWVVEHSGPGARVLFSGHHDGAFVYNLRTSDRDDINTLRLDKMLLEIESRVTLVRGQKDYSKEEILELIYSYCVDYVVKQNRFLEEHDQMKKFDELLRDNSNFEKVAEMPITSNIWGDISRYDVYRVKKSSYSGPCRETITYTIPLIGIELEGSFKKSPNQSEHDKAIMRQ